jgi:RHS repeat-associated protein
VWRWDQQEPFGNNPADENPSGLGAFDLPLRLPGQYFEKETNLHYNYFRDYDPSLGRYLESDPVGLDGGLNTYAYVDDAPTQFSDPSGLLTCNGSWVNTGWRPDNGPMTYARWPCTCSWYCRPCTGGGGVITTTSGTQVPDPSKLCFKRWPRGGGSWGRCPPNVRNSCRCEKPGEEIPCTPPTSCIAPNVS